MLSFFGGSGLKKLKINRFIYFLIDKYLIVNTYIVKYLQPRKYL